MASNICHQSWYMPHKIIHDVERYVGQLGKNDFLQGSHTVSMEMNALVSEDIIEPRNTQLRENNK